MPLDNQDNSERQVDTATYVAAKIFGAVSLPLHISFAQAAAIETGANMAQNLDGADAFTNGGLSGGPIDTRTKEQRQREADEESYEYFTSMIERQQRLAEQERERAWLDSTHTYAGQTLTGAEWKTMIDWFRDDENVAAWEDAMMAETGGTREDVRRTGGKMKRFYDLMEKDARGTLTKDEQRDFGELQGDRDVRRGIEVQQEIQGLRVDRGRDHTAQSDRNADADQAARIRTRSDLNEDVAGQSDAFSKAPNLASAYQAASSGNTLPAPQPVPTAPVAANTVKVSPDNIFG